MPNNETPDFIPVPGPALPAATDEFIPVAPAPASGDDFVPAGGSYDAARADYLGRLPRSGIVREMREAEKRGENLAPYVEAHAKRASEGSIFDKDRTKPDEGLVQGASQFVKSAFEGGSQFVQGGLQLFDNLTRAVTGKGAISGVGSFSPRRTIASFSGFADLTPEEKREFDTLAAEGMLAAEMGTLQGLDEIRQGADSLYNKFYLKKGDLSPEARADYAGQLYSDLESLRTYEQLASGVGQMVDVRKAKLDTDPDRINTIAEFADLSDWVPIGFGVKAGASSLKSMKTAATVLERAATPEVGTIGKATARIAQRSADALRRVETAVDDSPLVRGVAAGLATAAAGANPAVAIVGGLLGANVKPLGVAKATLGRAANAAQSFADKSLGKIPPGPIGAFAASAYRAVKPAMKDFVSAQLANTPFLLGAQSEEELRDQLAVNAVLFGAGLGTTYAIGKTMSSLDIPGNYFRTGARTPESRLDFKDYGSNPTADTAHRAMMGQINNAGNNLVASIRKYLGDRGEVYVLSEDGYNAVLDSWVQAGIYTPEQADIAKQQQGLQDEIPNGQGGKKAVSLTKVSEGAPGLAVGHETGHLVFQNLMSPEEKADVLRKVEQYYGPENIDAYRARHEALLNAGRADGKPPVTLSHQQILEEIVAENFSAIINSIPVGKFGLDVEGKSKKDFTRNLYGFVGRALENLGVKTTKLNPEPGVSLQTGLGIEPSIRLGTILENVLQAKQLDADILTTPETTGAKPAEPAAPAPAAPPPGLSNVQPVAAPAQPPVKRGDPIGELRDANGMLTGEDAVISKVFKDEGRVEVTFTDPDTGTRMTGEMAIAELPVSAVRPTVTTVSTGPKSPVTSTTPPGAVPAPGERSQRPATAADLVVPRQVENVARPQAEKVRARQIDQFGNATPELQTQTRAQVDRIVAAPRGTIVPHEIDYAAALADAEDPTQGVRQEQRRLADAAEAEAKRTGVPNPLRKIFQKVFVPFKREGGQILAWSPDKLVSNLDILRGWLAENPEAAKLFDMPYLLGEGIAGDLTRYLDNLAHGYAGDGRKLTRPADTRPGSVAAEDPKFKPHQLSPERMRVLNLLQGLEQPDTRTPGLEYALRFARENGIAPSPTGETADPNPLRAELRNRFGFEAGKGRLLESAMERLNISRILSPLTPRPDLPFRAGDTGIVQAGFMPAAPNTPEFKKWFGDWTDEKRFTSRAKEPVSVVMDFPPSRVQKDAMAQQVFGLSSFEQLGPNQQKDVLSKLPNGEVTEASPKVVYHGTREDFTQFETGRKTFDNYGIFGNVETRRHGIFFSDSPDQAASYVTDSSGRIEPRARTVPVYLDIKSPANFISRGAWDIAEEVGVNPRWTQHKPVWGLFDGPEGAEFVAALKKAGYDGAIFQEGAIRSGVNTGNTYVVFDPQQVKSAIGNVGTFDPENPDIRYMPAKKPLEKATAERLTPTGWVLPNGKYAGVSAENNPNFQNVGDFHSNWLQRNGAEWGLESGDRLAALNKGFVRVRLDGRTGRLGIEANKKFVRGAVLDKILDVVEENGNRIGNLDVNLFDDKGKVVKSDSLQFFRLPVAERYGATKDLLTSRRSADFMPAVPGLVSPLEDTLSKIPAKATRQQIEAALRDGVKEKGQLVARPAKAEEMRDTRDSAGLSFEQFLKDNPTAGRQEMLDFVSENKVQIEERELDKDAFSESDRTKFEQYVLPGGKEYRETLLTLPVVNPNTFTRDQLRVVLPGETDKYGVNHDDQPRVWIIDGPDNLYQIQKSRFPTAEAALDYVFATKQPVPPSDLNFTSSHFPDQPGYLAHARHNERTTAAGEKVFHVEEIQSDLHQKGRKEGYRQPMTKAREDLLYNQQAELNKLRRAEDDGDKVAEYDQKLAEIRDEFKRAQSNTPDAPFKKTWHELVFKRMLQKAVDADAAYLTWTTGEQQADRYDLSKQIEAIVYKKTGYNQYTVEGHRSIDIAFVERDIPLSRVEDLLGKDIARKIESGEGKQNTPSSTKVLEGVDLKVGGEGMKGFYDRILPEFAAKYLKRFGIKPETILVGTPDDGRGGFGFEEESDGIEYQEDTEVHAVRLTPDLKTEIQLKGQPMYMPSDKRKFRAAVWVNGKVYDGNIHYDAMLNAADAGAFAERKIRNAQEFDEYFNKNPHGFFTALRITDGFVDNEGNFYTREQTAKEIDKPHLVSPDSFDIPPAQRFMPAKKEVDAGALSGERVDMRPATLDDFSKDNVQGILDRSDWAILTAHNRDAKQQTPEQNATQNAALEAELQRLGVEYTPVLGKYGNTEDSFAVVGLPVSEAQRLIQDFGQESALTPRGLLYQDGSVQPATGITVHDKAPDDYYTTLPDGTTFTANIDFDAPRQAAPSFMPEPALAGEQVGALADTTAKETFADARGVSSVPLRTGEEKIELPAKPTVLDLGRALAARSRKILRIPYDSRTEHAKQAIARTLNDELEHAIAQDGNAIGWYEAKISEALDTLNELHPELSDPVQGSLYKALLAITSNGQAVDENFARAEYLYSEYKKNGRIGSDSTWGGQRAKQINGSLGLLQGMIDRFGLDKTVEFLNTKYTVKELRAAAAAVGIPDADTLITGEAVSHEVWGSAVFGPKIGGGFYANLNGDFNPVTIDLWLMRTWNRINGSYGVSNRASMAGALELLRKAADENPTHPDAEFISGASDRQLGNWADRRYADWKNVRKFKNPDAFDRPAKQFSESKDGATESPRNSSERAFLRETFSEVDRIREEKGLPPINNADKQAAMWFYEKDLYAKHGVTNKKQAPSDYALAAKKVIDRARSGAGSE